MKSENNILRILTAEEAAESDRAYESFDRIVDKKKGRAVQAFKALCWMHSRK